MGRVVTKRSERRNQTATGRTRAGAQGRIGSHRQKRPCKQPNRRSMMPTDPTEIIKSQADAARGILEDFGPEKAMGYLIGEKFLNFLEVAETDRQWRQAIPAFVAGIKALFEPF